MTELLRRAFGTIDVSRHETLRSGSGWSASTAPVRTSQESMRSAVLPKKNFKVSVSPFRQLITRKPDGF